MKLPRLTRCELELMDVVWRKGSATIREVCDSLKRPLAYTTVATTLGLLQTKKKVLSRVVRSNTHVYVPIVSREDVVRATIGEMWEPLFAAHPIGMILALLDSGDFSTHDIQALKDAIRDCEGKGLS